MLSLHSIQLQIKLSNFYHTSTDYLLGRTDEKTPYPKPQGIGHR